MSDDARSLTGINGGFAHFTGHCTRALLTALLTALFTERQNLQLPP